MTFALGLFLGAFLAWLYTKPELVKAGLLKLKNMFNGQE